MVKAANLRYSNDRSEYRRVHKPRFGRILGQRKMRSGFVIVMHELDVLIQCGFAEDDYVIQALSPDRADYSFHVGSLPG